MNATLTIHQSKVYYQEGSDLYINSGCIRGISIRISLLNFSFVTFHCFRVVVFRGAFFAALSQCHILQDDDNDDYLMFYM